MLFELIFAKYSKTHIISQNLEKKSYWTYSSSLLHVNTACNHLPLFKKIFKFFTFLAKFSNILPSFLKITPMPLISRIGHTFNIFELDSNCLYWSRLKRLISGRFILLYLFKRFISTK